MAARASLSCSRPGPLAQLAGALLLVPLHAIHFLAYNHAALDAGLDLDRSAAPGYGREGQDVGVAAACGRARSGR